MRRGKYTGAGSASGPLACLLLGSLIILGLAGCSEPPKPTSESEPVSATATIRSSALTPAVIPGPTSAPTPAVILLPTPELQETSTMGPIPTADVTPTAATPSETSLQAFSVPSGSRPHDVAPALDGGVWYTAQGSGDLGWLDPKTGETRHTPLGAGSRPHGVIVGPDGAPWVTDGGLNAIVRVDPGSLVVDVFPLPAGRPDANLNTATFGLDGVLWFTGQNGV